MKPLTPAQQPMPKQSLADQYPGHLEIPLLLVGSAGLLEFGLLLQSQVW